MLHITPAEHLRRPSFEGIVLLSRMHEIDDGTLTESLARAAAEATCLDFQSVVSIASRRLAVEPLPLSSCAVDEAVG